MDNETFWIRLWTLAALLVISIAGSLIMKSANYNKAYLDALAKSADPIALSCAITIADMNEGTQSTSLLCVDKARK